MTKEQAVYAARQIRNFCRDRVCRYQEDACEKCIFGNGEGCCRLNIWPERWRITNKDFGEVVNIK